MRTSWNKGIHTSEEIKAKMRLAHKIRKEKLGYINSLEARKKISEAKLGHKVSQETRNKISLAQVNKN